MTEQLNTETAPPLRRAKLLDLSLTQLIAGSFAAATAAFLGSRIGWVGTVTGAAIGSVVSAVAASLYTASMTRAREALRWQKLLSRQAQSTLRDTPAPTPSGVQSGPVSPPSGVQHAPVRTPRRVLATAGVLFAVAAAFLTGLQLATGADVTGTSLGPRQSTAEVEQDAPSGVQEPDRDAPSTDPSAIPGSTSPAAREAAAAPEPTDASGVTAPSDGTGPATPTPTETVSPDPATSATPTQPTTPVGPTTPAG